MNPVNKYVRIVSAIIITFGAWFFIVPEIWNASVPFIFSVLVIVGAPIIAYFLLKPIFNEKQNENEEN